MLQRKIFLLAPQAQMPEQMLEPTPRFGPAAKAARAKEREEEAARLAKEKKAAAAAKPAAKPQCAPVCCFLISAHGSPGGIEAACGRSVRCGMTQWPLHALSMPLQHRTGRGQLRVVPLLFKHCQSLSIL